MRVQQRDDSQRGTSVSTPVPPLPALTPLTSALSKALENGVQLQQCQSCGIFTYYPRVVCPECLSDALEWRPVSGLGELLSYGVIWRSLHPSFAGSVPLHLCTVQLQEGPVVLALLDDVARQDVAIGVRVRLVGVEIASGIRLPRFVPAA
jgi:uncharacterized OB-fold protein